MEQLHLYHPNELFPFNHSPTCTHHDGLDIRSDHPARYRPRHHHCYGHPQHSRHPSHSHLAAAPPDLEKSKAKEFASRSRYPDPSHTQCHSVTPSPHHTDTNTPDPQHTLLHETPTPTHECMYVYDCAAQYDLQTAIQGTTKRHMINIKRRTLRSIQDAIAYIILQTCLGDPRDDPESAYLPHEPHTSAIYMHVRGFCRPLQE
jgi:hypothetical protein